MYPYLEYIPAYLRQIKEYRAIGQAVEPTLKILQNETILVYLNQFLDVMDRETVMRWERILSLSGMGTLDERRYAIAAKRIRYLPFTNPSLRQMLAILCGENGFTLDILYSQHLLRVRVALESQNNYSAVLSLLLELKPATMLLDLNLMYNSYKLLGQFTYRQMSRYTYKELREKRFQFNTYRKLGRYAYTALNACKYYQLMMEELPDE